MIEIEGLPHAIEILSLHNEWRRGAEIEMTDPATLGAAIEEVLNAARKWHNSTHLQSALDTQGEKQCGDVGELEAAINKSGGPRLGNPDYVFTDMKTVKILREAASAHLAAIKGEK